MEDSTSMNMVPFSFEGATVRVVRDEVGEPWFVAKDVAETLGYVWNGAARIAHVPETWRRVTSVVTPRGEQEMAMLSEHGLYFFLARSDKPKARPFQEWLAGDVLPSIRRTGVYAVPSAQPALLKLRVTAHDVDIVVKAVQLASESVARVPGVKPEILAAQTLSTIQEATGLPLEQLRKALPANTEPLASLNPTQLGERLGLSAREVNLRLAGIGLQFKNPRREWELTEAGRDHAEAVPYATGRHAGYQILWKESVISVLRSLQLAG